MTCCVFPNYHHSSLRVIRSAYQSHKPTAIVELNDMAALAYDFEKSIYR
jgi:hypothetical protein